MNPIANGKVYQLIIGSQENGFRIIVGKKLKNSGTIKQIIFDEEHYQLWGHFVFHITHEISPGVETYLRTIVNQRVVVVYNTDSETE